MKFSELKGEVLDYIDVDPENDTILLTTRSGRKVLIHHRQDCCESVRIVDTIGEWRNIVGKVIVDAVHESKEVIGEHDCAYSRTDTDLIFRVDDATVISRWVGESNGYYSEDVDISDITSTT